MREIWSRDCYLSVVTPSAPGVSTTSCPRTLKSPSSAPKTSKSPSLKLSVDLRRRYERPYQLPVTKLSVVSNAIVDSTECSLKEGLPFRSTDANFASSKLLIEVSERLQRALLISSEMLINRDRHRLCHCYKVLGASDVNKLYILRQTYCNWDAILLSLTLH